MLFTCVYPEKTKSSLEASFPVISIGTFTYLNAETDIEVNLLLFQVQSDMKTAMKAVREQGSAKMEEELKSLQDKLEQERANHRVSKCSIILSHLL